MKTFWSFVVLIAILFTLCLLTGCAQMGTRQTDTNTTTRYEIDKKGQTNAVETEVRETTTRSSGRAVLSGKSTFEGLDASQDGTSQGLKVKKAAQQTDGMMQAVEMLRLMKELGGMAYGIPPAQSVQQAPQTIQPSTRTVPGVMLQTPPQGMKWILAPTDNPSTPQPEDQ